MVAITFFVPSETVNRRFAVRSSRSDGIVVVENTFRATNKMMARTTPAPASVPRSSELSYVGSLLMAGAYLAIGACASALTRNQVIAFILAAAMCFLFTATGMPFVTGALTGLAPQSLIETIAGLSALAHFESVIKGVLDVRDLVYFVSLIVLWLIAGVVALNVVRGTA